MSDTESFDPGKAMNEKAELLLTEIFFRSNQRFGEVEDYRSVAIKGMPSTGVLIQQDSNNTASMISKLDKIFIDKEAFLNIVGGIDGLSSGIANMRIASYQIAIDSASIVLAHSILDATAIDCCRVVEIVSPPEKWEPFVKNKQISLEKLKNSDYLSILKKIIKQYIQELGRKSLNDKIDKLFELCKPPANFNPILNHQYNKDRIKKIDSWRHNVVHGPGLPPPLQNCGEDIKYMRDTSNFLICLVNYGYNVRVNPTLFKESLKQKALLKHVTP